jgi:hypothetical protein
MKSQEFTTLSASMEGHNMQEFAYWLSEVHVNNLKKQSWSLGEK